MYVTHQKLSEYILFLLLLVLPIDMINGVLLNNNINLPISISQLYKMLILGLMLFQLAFNSDKIYLFSFVFGSLFLSSVVQALTTFDFSFLFSDFIKVTKYLSIPIAFFYFKTVIQTHNNEFLVTKIFKWISFSYWVLASNIFIKIFNLGYPMYDYGNIGTRGFFFAGNEISSLLLVTSAIIGYKYWVINKNRLRFFAFFVFNLFLAILVSSKTVFLGVFLVFTLICIITTTLKVKIKTLKIISIVMVTIIPLTLYFTYQAVLKAPVMVRIKYFWEKLDLVTFIFSSRNIFTREMFIIYDNNFTIIQKLIGGGQHYYETQLSHIIEIDALDIFFAYGYLGAILFSFMLVYLVIQSYLFKKKSCFPYATLTFFMSLLLLAISSIAGHIFNSGIAGNFLGLLFALMYLKKNEEQISL